jgi:carnitine 3-dehydrogenase
VVAGCEEEAAGRSIADLVHERDRRLVDMLRVLGKEVPGDF